MSIVLLWCVTYLAHSTSIVLAVLVYERFASSDDVAKSGAGTRGAREWAWRAALVGGVISASVQVGLGLKPLTGTATLPLAVQATPNQVDALASATPPARVPSDASTLVPTTSTNWTVSAQRQVQQHPTGWFLLTVLGLIAAAMIVDRRRLHRALGERIALDNPHWNRLFAELTGMARPWRKPRLTTSDSLESPIAFGVLTPEICVPSRAVRELDAGLARAVLAHELAHIVRHDPAWRELAHRLRQILFFQPANRLIARRLVSLSELGADARAAGWTGDGLAQARSLTAVARWIERSDTPRPACAMVRHRRALDERVQRLIEFARRPFREERLAMVRVAVSATLLLMPWALPGWRAAVAEQVGFDSSANHDSDRTWPAAAARLEALSGALSEVDSDLAGFDATTDPTLLLRLNALQSERARLADQVQRRQTRSNTIDLQPEPTTP